MPKSNFGDKEILTDALSSQKFVTDNYNIFANECANPAIKTEFINILNEEHQIQYDVFAEMQKRGWYPTEQAEETKINSVKQKFSAPKF